MCLIIDANFIAITLSPSPPKATEPLQKALYARKARGVYGGKLAREYAHLAKFARLIAELDRRGILHQLSAEDIDAETKRVEGEGNCISNDAHIIAIARAGNVRLLCSNDTALHTDFKNPLVLSPTGHVYQDQTHAHLIRKACKNIS